MKQKDQVIPDWLRIEQGKKAAITGWLSCLHTIAQTSLPGCSYIADDSRLEIPQARSLATLAEQFEVFGGKLDEKYFGFLQNFLAEKLKSDKLGELEIFGKFRTI
jgi:hypothetical protein